MTAAMLPGATYRIGRAASVQFAGVRGLVLRVIGVDDKSTWQGWAFVNGYVLDAAGRATEVRTVYVRLAGTVLIPAQRPAGHPSGRAKPVNATPAAAAPRPMTAQAVDCMCGHTSPLHALTATYGRRGRCSGSSCPCRAFAGTPAVSR